MEANRTADLKRSTDSNPAADSALTPDTLARMPAGIERPAYDARQIAIGVVHLGPGAFHRAHQAWFFDALLGDDPRWGISAVSLRSPDLRDALVGQDGLYTVATLDAVIGYRVIGALRERLVAAEDPQRVLNRLAAPTTHIVTLTITEKGYCLAGDGTLDFSHPDIVRDLADPDTPVSAIGYLVAALARRHAAGLDPFTVISCDNLADNGHRLGAAVIALAACRDEALARWIQARGAFPRTMVDSIVPATDDALRERVTAATGLIDRWPVQRERFAQWVIENRFSSATPDWASVGVTITDDVGGFESAKLRLLNGAHSTLAYLGLARGHTSVAEAMTDDPLVGFVRTMMIQDIRPSVRAPNGFDVDAYVEAVLQRFRNPAIRHELAQIAWDGSQKLPFRLLGTISDALAAGRGIARLCVPIAAWMHFVRRKALGDRRLTDPLASTLLAIGDACEDRAETDVPRFLALENVFPAALRGDRRFIDALMRAHARLADPAATLE